MDMRLTILDMERTPKIGARHARKTIEPMSSKAITTNTLYFSAIAFSFVAIESAGSNFTTGGGNTGRENNGRRAAFKDPKTWKLRGLIRH